MKCSFLRQAVIDRQIQINEELINADKVISEEVKKLENSAKV